MAGQQQIQETRFLDQRNEEMQNLANQIDDIHAIQTELNQLVHAQGQTVNDIEAHIEETAVQVDEGVEQLRQAGESAKSGRKWKIIIAIAVVVLVIVLLSVFWQYIKLMIPGL